MPLDLIAFDLDGTILDSNKKISPRNYMAMKKAIHMGIKLVPCTGRSMFEIPDALNQFADEAGFAVFPYIITDNGGQIYDFPNNKLLFSKKIPKKTSLALIAKERKLLALTYGSFGSHGSTDKMGLAFKSEEAKPYIKMYREIWNMKFADLEELIEWNCGTIRFSISFLHKKDCDSFFKEVSKYPNLTISSSMHKSIDIMTKGISKGEALKFISRHASIPMEKIMAIGDNLNDMEMIVEARFGVAMGNAIPELKEKADWVTSDNDNDGFALAIEKMLGEY